MGRIAEYDHIERNVIVPEPIVSRPKVRKVFDGKMGYYRYFLEDGTEVSDERGALYGEGNPK